MNEKRKKRKKERKKERKTAAARLNELEKEKEREKERERDRIFGKTWENVGKCGKMREAVLNEIGGQAGSLIVRQLGALRAKSSLHSNKLIRQKLSLFYAYLSLSLSLGFSRNVAYY